MGSNQPQLNDWAHQCGRKYHDESAFSIISPYLNLATKHLCVCACMGASMYVHAQLFCTSLVHACLHLKACGDAYII